ncbi:uncharacterized protein A4U43_C07F7590 [Asparagus officinalis]|uniref:Uncharacterized protein n=1 Tax=Asparagus officinalis TaxID=4686 RepID=A0A5P1EA25_ASPOF|nr:uncharacterized protein A4U43_C07F7590 [Asparagus officinalis]
MKFQPGVHMTGNNFSISRIIKKKSEKKDKETLEIDPDGREVAGDGRGCGSRDDGGGDEARGARVGASGVGVVADLENVELGAGTLAAGAFPRVRSQEAEDRCQFRYPQGMFLKMFLGTLNVQATRKEVRLKVKEEYNDYRWIFRHYCAMLMALVNLTWEIKGQPDCANKTWQKPLVSDKRKDRKFRLSVEASKHFSTGVLHGFEAYVGILLLKTAFVGVASEWQVIFCSILLVIMAVGNFANTVQTLMAKSRFKAKMRRTKSKQDLEHSLSPPSGRWRLLL